MVILKEVEGNQLSRIAGVGFQFHFLRPVGVRLSGGLPGRDFCGSANIAGKFKRTAETAKLAAVYKLMLRGQCFLFSPKARKGTPKSLASSLIFDQSE